MLLFSIDEETTGLDPNKGLILQIGYILIDTKTKKLAKRLYNIVHKSDEIKGSIYAMLKMPHNKLLLETMPDYSVNMGLGDLSRNENDFYQYYEKDEDNPHVSRPVTVGFNTTNKVKTYNSLDNVPEEFIDKEFFSYINNDFQGDRLMAWNLLRDIAFVTETQLSQYSIDCHKPNYETRLPYKLTRAGKNIFEFDLPWLEIHFPLLFNAIKSNSYLRSADPAVLYGNLDDDSLPNLEECKIRSGIFESNDVTHNSYEDASDVALLILNHFGLNLADILTYESRGQNNPV